MIQYGIWAQFSICGKNSDPLAIGMDLAGDHHAANAELLNLLDSTRWTIIAKNGDTTLALSKGNAISNLKWTVRQLGVINTRLNSMKIRAAFVYDEVRFAEELQNPFVFIKMNHGSIQKLVILGCSGDADELIHCDQSLASELRL